MARNSVNRYFEGLLVGAAVGFIAGLLSAKKPGTELRRELAEQYDDLLRQANDQLGDLKSNLSDKVKPIADRASIYGERVQQYGEKVKAQAVDLKERVADRAQDLKQQVVGAIQDKQKARSGADGKELVDNYMGNFSGPMYTPGAKASPDQSASSMGDACSNSRPNMPEAAGG